jgi:predicted nucleic acid-binding Zn ribbon protein
LTFHHLRDKSFDLTARNMSNRPWEAVLSEAEKCVLLCANCHMAEHRPDLALDAARELVRVYVLEPPRQTTPGFCMGCGEPLMGRKKKFCSTKCKNSVLQSYERQRARGIARKLELVDKLGGACNRCGYAQNLAALNFHHVDGKDYKLDLRSLGNRTTETILAEFERVELLCANCHAAEHADEEQETPQ